MKTIYLAGGCFWGVEKYFSMVKGVLSTMVGYANGTKDNPSYLDLKHGFDDASETVKIEYDEKTISLEKILELRKFPKYFLNISSIFPLCTNSITFTKSGSIILKP